MRPGHEYVHTLERIVVFVMEHVSERWLAMLRAYRLKAQILFGVKLPWAAAGAAGLLVSSRCVLQRFPIHFKCIKMHGESVSNTKENGGLSYNPGSLSGETDSP